MEEELSLDNILGAEEIDNLFVEDDAQETPPPSKDDGEDSSEKNSDNEEIKGSFRFNLSKFKYSKSVEQRSFKDFCKFLSL